MIRYLLAPSFDLASTVETPDLTVEAEYGSRVVCGRLYTAAHHGAPGTQFEGRHTKKEGGRPSPCNDPNIPVLGEDAVVVISHLDLDTFGGCLRAHPGFQDLFTEGSAPFWRLAEFVDVSGPHQLATSWFDTQDKARLRAFWAWHRVQPRQDLSRVTDVTLVVEIAGEVLRRILADDEEFLERGRALAKEKAALDKASFRLAIPLGDLADRSNVLLVRESEVFVNHLYTTPHGVEAKALIAFNPKVGSVTISVPRADPRLSCRDAVQAVFGPLAGGHGTIAGTPRGVHHTWVDVDKLVNWVCAKLR
jgi:hypothetical protein